MGESDLEGIGELPEAVRVVGWMPLGALLPTCSAVVHHAGAGTSMTSLALGVPQVVLPQTADQPANARVLAARGVAALVPPDRISAAEVRENLARVLDEPAFRTAAHEVRGEVRAMPSPAEVVDRLASLVA
jgi:UDP:flavonoid glycosyltransferase YjiC (YdhE family)